MRKRKPNSAALDAAFARLLDAVSDPAVAARYPRTTFFIPADAAYLTLLVSEGLESGGAIAVVYVTGEEVLFSTATAFPDVASSTVRTEGASGRFDVDGASSALLRREPVTV